MAGYSIVYDEVGKINKSFACFLSKAVSFVTPSLNLADSPFWPTISLVNPLYTNNLRPSDRIEPRVNHPVLKRV